MKNTNLLRMSCFAAISPLLLPLSLQAKPNTSIKSTLAREEDPRAGFKNSRILPYVFPSESMGFSDETTTGWVMFGQPF
ncbi:MAG: hypothetical protein K9K37_07705 [Desulfocapsa sp.]|nr:hypothetical protein [Desulfocapsa sp.]